MRGNILHFNWSFFLHKVATYWKKHFGEWLYTFWQGTFVRGTDIELLLPGQWTIFHSPNSPLFPISLLWKEGLNFSEDQCFLHFKNYSFQISHEQLCNWRVLKVYKESMSTLISPKSLYGFNVSDVLTTKDIQRIPCDNWKWVIFKIHVSDNIFLS